MLPIIISTASPEDAILVVSFSQLNALWGFPETFGIPLDNLKAFNRVHHRQLIFKLPYCFHPFCTLISSLLSGPTTAAIINYHYFFLTSIKYIPDGL